MGTAVSDIDSVLAEAIYREEQACRLYTDLAAGIKNPDGARIFSILAEDEKGHRTKLEEWYGRIAGRPFVFDESNVEAIDIRIDEQAAAMDALSLALDAERKAAERYEALAARAGDASFLELCRALAEEEWGHFDTIQAEKQALSDEFYWFDLDSAGHMED